MRKPVKTVNKTNTGLPKHPFGIIRGYECHELIVRLLAFMPHGVRICATSDALGR